MADLKLLGPGESVDGYRTTVQVRRGVISGQACLLDAADAKIIMALGVALARHATVLFQIGQGIIIGHPVKVRESSKKIRKSTMQRRAFLQISGGAIAGANWPIVASLRAAEASATSFGAFKIGVQSYCFHRFKLPVALKQIEALGLKYVELFPGHAPLGSSDKQAAFLLRLCLEHGVTPLALGVVKFTKDHGKNRQAFDHAQRMGIKVLSADPETNSFDSLDRLVEEYGIPIAIHPHGPQGEGKLHLWHRAEIIMEAVKDHHPLIGTCLDTGHLIRCGLEPHNLYLDPVQQIRFMGPRNFGIHLKDNDNKVNRNVVIGRGALDVPGVLQALRQIEFDGCISIEHEANPEDPVPDIAACIEVIQRAVRDIR